MDPVEQLQAWAAQGESETQEFKTSTGSRVEGIKSLSAMVNGRGGRVLFGVSPAGQVKGQQVADKTLEDLAETVRRIEPPAPVTIDRVPLPSGSEVLVVSTPSGRFKPYTFAGKAWRRLGATTVALSAQERDRLMLEQLHAGLRWEQEPSLIEIHALDLERLRRVVDAAVQANRATPPGDERPEALLRGLGLVRDGRLTHAAAVLFARREVLGGHYPQLTLKRGRFRGTSKATTELADNRQDALAAFDLLDQAERFHRDHVPVASRIVEGKTRRQDRPAVPALAFREAIANAICHREYHDPSGSISVAVYDDRVEVSSTGPLHFGMSVADLYRDHDSRPWNPSIANVLYLAQVVERWGSGTTRMVAVCREHGLATPEIIDDGATVRVVFLYPGAVPLRFRHHTMTVSAQRVLAAVAEAEPVMLSELVARLESDVTERTVRRSLNQLRDLGAVISTGTGRGARWELTQPSVSATG